MLRPATDDAVIADADLDRRERQMRRVGTLEFTLKGQPLKLTAFVEVGAPNLDHLFVPFTDLTSGTETYAGRPLSRPRSQRHRHLRASTSTRRTTRTATTTRHTTARIRPPRTACKMPIRAGERLKHPEPS